MSELLNNITKPPNNNNNSYNNNSGSNNNSNFQNSPYHPSPSPLPSYSLSSSSSLSLFYPVTIKFVDVCYKVKTEPRVDESDIKRYIHTCKKCITSSSSCDSSPKDNIQEKSILNGITGIANPGEILAVLGPSGSGKSTLLNALSGRLNGPSLTGSILANDKKLTKQILKRTGFVSQDDILYPHLTVKETLLYCALLRLPNTLTRPEKLSVVNYVISELGLSKCEDTIIGNTFIRGVSGGERKRVSIAHEMLVNPSLLILDEPTSGLDSTSAYRLVASLEGLARRGGKTVMMSVHQPSSRVYQMFDTVLVLCEGRGIYYGKGREAMVYFESVGFSPSFPINPADFLLDLANGVECHLQGDHGMNERDHKSNTKQTLISSFNNILAPKIKASCQANTSPKNNIISSNDNTFLALESTKFSTQKMTQTATISTWLNQFTILLQRSLKERRHESFNALRVAQVIGAALLSGIIWWHSHYKDIQDRLGLLFFISIFWGVFPSFNAVFAFPQDRAIFKKEWASGMYSLSSYFMARITGDLPMELLLPTIFLTLVYWMTGLEAQFWAFLLTLGVVLGFVLVAQGLGLAVGAIIMDAKRASTVVTIIMLGCVLTGGFYVHKLPMCLGWIKYLSLTYYCYRLLIYVQYGGGKEVSTSLGCSRHVRITMADCKFIEDDIDEQIGPLLSIWILVLMFLGFRVLAYLALKHKKL